MKLKAQTETVHFVDDSDFNKFVKKIYGGDYEFISNQEANNDTDYTFKVEKKKRSRYELKDQKKLEKSKTKVIVNNFFLIVFLMMDTSKKELI